MTDDQRKKYEEAARDWAYNRLIDQRLHPQDLRDAYFEGCTFASQDTEERLKQAYTAAIDKALAIVKDAYYSDSDDKILAIEGQIQKLKL